MLFYSSLAIINQTIKHKKNHSKIPYNKKGFELILLLYKMGYLNSYYVSYNHIYFELKNYQNQFPLNGFHFYTKPGHIRSITLNQLRRAYKNKKKIFILSTLFGICTTLDAIKMNQGGLILAEIK